jgi:hypothetical protein
MHEDALVAAGHAAGVHPGQARGGVDTAWRGPADRTLPPVAVRLSGSPGVDIRGADVYVLSGTATGSRIGVLSVIGDIAVFGPGGADAIGQLRPGDTVRLDNSGYLAAETYHRHQVPEEDGFDVWDQFRGAEGSPLYPQRPLLLGPLFAAAAAGTVQTGRFEGKMIVVESLLDREALPWQADWYRSKVHEHLGNDIDEHFRLWFTENALHGDDEVQESPLHTVSYLGMLHLALRDLSRWVEEDVAPPSSTNYEVVDGQVVVPAEASRRLGIQPVVSLTVDGAARSTAPVGGNLTFRATAEAPPETGFIVSVEWDFDGSGRFSEAERIDPTPHVSVERQHSFAVPGTYFPVVRVVARREGSRSRAFGRLQNLARVRVVVGQPRVG